MTNGVANGEIFVLRHGPIGGSPGDLLDRSHQPAAQIALNDSSLSFTRPDWTTTLTWPLSSIVSITLVRLKRNERGTPSFLVYSTSIEFGSGEKLTLGIHQQRREFEGIGERDASAYRLFVDSLHRRLVMHATAAKMFYRGGPLLQSGWMILAVLIAAFLAVDWIGALFVSRLVAAKAMTSS